MTHALSLLEAAASGMATIAAASLLAAGALVIAAQFRGERSARWRLGFQAIALFALAGFVWLRPGVKPAGAPSAGYLAIVGVGLPAAIAFALAATPLRMRVKTFLEQGGDDVARRLTAFAILLALPAAAIPVLTNWDVSGWMDSHSYDAFAINIATGKVVEGNSAYMPVYQYGLASVYYVFGHFYFAQQIVNLFLALAGVAALCLAAWTLFRSPAAVIIAGLLAAYSTPLYYAVHFTQIESWYVPIVCVLLLVWARYWREPSLGRAIGLACALGVALNTRNQGGLFFALVCATPLMATGLRWRTRLAHAMVVAALVAVSLVPWTLRNYAVEGRLSPMAARSAIYMGVLTDHRVGLYGIRYWEGWDEVVTEYQARFPDPLERERAYLRAAWVNVVSDPLWTADAVAWRTAAFYGLLPDGYSNLAAVVPTDWRAEWRRFVFSRSTPLLLLPLSLLGVILRPDRTALFLCAAVAANVAIVLFAASPESRISYPVLPMHILLCASLFATRGPAPAFTARVQRAASRFAAYRAPMVAAAVVISLVVCRAAFGSRFAYRPLMERTTIVDPTAAISPDLPLLNDLELALPGGSNAGSDFGIGRRVRLRCLLSNYMYPPKFVGPVDGIPAFATDPSGPTFYYSYLLTGGAAPSLGPVVGLTFVGAHLIEQVREGDAVEIEGEVLRGSADAGAGFWLRAIAIRKLAIPAAALPPFA
jgi:4-amino-4-deoxy-L-arabinose transferase-like glycosyltransferase